MPRKRPAASEVSSSRSRSTRRSTTSASKRKPSQESEPDSDEELETEPSTSKKGKRGQMSSNRGRGGSKSKRSSYQVRQETVDDCEDEEQEIEENEESTHEEPTAETPSTSKKQWKTGTKKNKKKETPPDTPSVSSDSSPSRSSSPTPSGPNSDATPKKGGKSDGTSSAGKKKKKEKESTNEKNATVKRNKQKDEEEEEVEKEDYEEEEEEEEEEDVPYEIRKIRMRVARKERRREEARNRPKLTFEQKLEKLKKKKERRERRKDRDREDLIRQKYGSRKMRAEASKWNFGPISSINQRRRDEMMAYFPKANFSSDNGVPKVMNNFRRATVKYNMEVLNPFITCSICDGYIVDATTIIDCMHTFCKSCLLTYFEADNKTCPTCGTFIHGSHPTHYVTYDRAVNELVNQFVPKLEKIELDTRKLFLRDCREALGIDTVAEDRERKERLEKERIMGTNRCYPLERPRLSHHRDDCQVTVNLLPGTSNLPLITRPFVRCSEMTTMNTLKKFISLQIWDEQSRYSDLDMFCDGQLMGKDFSIRFVWMMKRRGQPKSEPLIIRYHMARS